MGGYSLRGMIYQHQTAWLAAFTSMTPPKKLHTKQAGLAT